MGVKLLLLSFFAVLTISTTLAARGPKKPPAITLTAQELRTVVNELVISEVREAINSEGLGASPDLTSQVQEIRQAVQDLGAQVTEFIDSLNVSAVETRQECSAVGLAFGAENDSGSGQINRTGSIRDTMRTMSQDLQGIKEALRNRVPLRQSQPPKSNLTWGEFDALVQTKSPVRTGNTFNGQSLDSIISATRAIRDESVVVVFVNHLDEEITNLAIYDPSSVIAKRAPFTIAPHTEEVFTFTTSCCLSASFSYNVPSSGVHIATVLALQNTNAVGLSFLSSGTTIESYFDSMQGIVGSSQRLNQTGLNNLDTLKLSVGYRNVYARMQAMFVGNENRANVRVEIIQA